MTRHSRATAQPHVQPSRGRRRRRATTKCLLNQAAVPQAAMRLLWLRQRWRSRRSEVYAGLHHLPSWTGVRGEQGNYSWSRFRSHVRMVLISVLAQVRLEAYMIEFKASHRVLPHFRVRHDTTVPARFGAGGVARHASVRCSLTMVEKASREDRWPLGRHPLFQRPPRRAVMPSARHPHSDTSQPSRSQCLRGRDSRRAHSRYCGGEKHHAEQ